MGEPKLTRILLTLLFTLLALPAMAETVIIKGQKLTCPGVRIIVKDLNGAEGYAYIGGPMYVDPRLGNSVVFFHECAHAKGINSEAQADCQGIKMGKKARKIDMADINRMCRSLKNEPAGSGYSSGIERCRIMKQCFAN